MNIRKNIDYSEMYKALDRLMAQDLLQMELYCEIGKTVCQRSEKGAAVMASEYLNKHYPDVKGFSPRNLRRMRDFYCTYEKYPALLRRAMQLGWIQNVVIMEADLTMELREWYMKAAKKLGWSKTELITSIAENLHENINFAMEEVYFVMIHDKNQPNCYKNIVVKIKVALLRSVQKIRDWLLIWNVGRRRWCLLKHQILNYGLRHDVAN